MKKLSVLLVLMAFLGLSSFAMADSISPSTFTASGPTGTSYTVTKTVTVSAGTPTTSLVDVFFLADTTGSMGGTIGAVRTSAAAILAGAAGLGNVQFAVGEYKDNGDSYVYRLNQNITSSQPAAQAGINLWVASGGGDTPEAELYALQQMATTTAWRAGSTRIAVWFGDAPGHDPSGPTGVTLAGAIAALNANNVKVEAIDVGAMNSLGQAAAIATATGGAYLPGINSATIVAAISAAITSAFDTYTTVGIDTSEAPAGVGVTVTPGSILGSWDRSVERTFDFEVTFTDKEPGTHIFDIYGTVDGGRILPGEHDSITSGAAVPEPATMLLLGSGLIGLAGYGKRKFFRK